MSTNFPQSLDTFTNPTATDKLDTPGVQHDLQHANLNDAVKELQKKVGVDSSAITSSIDYKINNLAKIKYQHTDLGNGTGSVAVNLDGTPLQTTQATGNITISTSNRGMGKSVSLRIKGDTVQRTLAFAAGIKVLGTIPITIEANKVSIMTIASYGSLETDTVIGYAAEL